MPGTSDIRRTRRGRLASSIASLFALSAPVAAIADVWTVNDCSDDPLSGNLANKTGTLRYALAHATSPASINMTGLIGDQACPSSKITLGAAQGQLSTSIADLTLHGPGAQNLTIDAFSLGVPSEADHRVIASTGGRLAIVGLTLSHGKVQHSAGPALGGCVYAAGDLALYSSSVSGCSVESNGAFNAAGGAIYAKGTVKLVESYVGYGTATSYLVGSPPPGSALGGGIFAGGNLTLDTAIVRYNSAHGNSADARGGGVYANAAATIFSGAIQACGADGSTARGGGLFVKGTASLSQMSVTLSGVTGQASSSGGGIHANGNLDLQQVVLTGNTAHGGTANGGGAYAKGSFYAAYSNVSNNTAANACGGLAITGSPATIRSSTIAANTADASSSGVCDSVSYVGTSFELSNSTISGNLVTGTNATGALTSNAATVRMYNSTIAFNTSSSGYPAFGVTLYSDYGMSLKLQSTLIASNSAAGADYDLRATSTSLLTVNDGNLDTAANNLVRSMSAAVKAKLPTDTKTAALGDDACPHLGPLRYTGSLAATHRPLAGSAAIDAGNNVKGFQNDQRGDISRNGVATFARVSGKPGDPSPKADIGAHEVEQDDIVFGTDFEGCGALP